MSVAHRAKAISPEGIRENPDTVSDTIQLLLRFAFFSLFSFDFSPNTLPGNS